MVQFRDLFGPEKLRFASILLNNMNVEHNLPPKFDPFELLGDGGDPYVVYAKIRAAGPVLRAAPGIWVVARYQEVASLLHDSRLGPFQFQEAHRLPQQRSPDSSLLNSAANLFLDGVLVVASGSDHARLRKVATQ